MPTPIAPTFWGCIVSVPCDPETKHFKTTKQGKMWLNLHTKKCGECVNRKTFFASRKDKYYPGKTVPLTPTQRMEEFDKQIELFE
jgi:hypothetical protein